MKGKHSMKKEKAKKEKQTTYIRCDGWVISSDGMERLVKSGHKGHDRFMENTKKQIGNWHRVSKPLDRDAAEIIQSVKGMIPRAVFVSTAIVNEAQRRAARKGK